MVFREDSKLGSILRVATLSMEPNFVYKTSLYLHVSLSFVPDEGTKYDVVEVSYYCNYCTCLLRECSISLLIIGGEGNNLVNIQ